MVNLAYFIYSHFIASVVDHTYNPRTGAPNTRRLLFSWGKSGLHSWAYSHWIILLGYLKRKKNSQMKIHSKSCIMIANTSFRVSSHQVLCPSIVEICRLASVWLYPYFEVILFGAGYFEFIYTVYDLKSLHLFILGYIFPFYYE